MSSWILVRFLIAEPQRELHILLLDGQSCHATLAAKGCEYEEWKSCDQFCKQSTIKHSKEGIPKKPPHFSNLHPKNNGKKGEKKELGQTTQNPCKSSIKTIDNQGNNLDYEGRQLIVAGACYGWDVISQK